MATKKLNGASKTVKIAAPAVKSVAPLIKKATAYVPPPPAPRGVEVTSLSQLSELNLPLTLAMPLYRALKRARASDSDTEAKFVGWLVGHVSQYAEMNMIDTAGNVHFKIPKLDGQDSKTLFIAHTDTVHYQSGHNPFEVLGDKLQAGLGADCLGADNGAGLSLLVHMMANAVPGTYIFSRQEESSGIGAKLIADSFPKMLASHKRAITFDRRGTADIISHQGGTRCCSDAFAWALTDALNDRGMLYAPSDKGVYTDTKEFVGDVPECTNISTGYFQEHGPSEHLDLNHYRELAAAILTIDWESLPTERKPEAKRSYRSSFPAYSSGYSSGFSQEWEDEPVSENEIYDSIAEAIEGRTSYLKDILAEELYPEDPALGRRFLDMKQIDQKHYEQALKMLPEEATVFLLDLATVAEARL